MMKKLMVMLSMVLCVVFITAPVAEAAKKSYPYKDVTDKTVGEYAVKCVQYVKDHQGLTWIRGKKFYPSKNITRREFIMTLYGFYGDKVPVSYTDVAKANQKISQSYVVKKLISMGKVLGGHNLVWKGEKGTADRVDAMMYLYIFANFNDDFKPLKGKDEVYPSMSRGGNNIATGVAMPREIH